MDPKKTAEEILANVGGKSNVRDVSHCFTRLRLVLKDESLANKEVVEHIEGVIQVVEAGGGCRPVGAGRRVRPGLRRGGCPRGRARPRLRERGPR